MAWRHITFNAAAADVPRLEALLMVAGACSVAITDAGEMDLLEPAPGETPLWPHAAVTALFPDGFDLERLRNLVARELPESRDATVRTLADADWERAARAEIQPVDIGDRLRLLPADDPDPHDGRRTLRLGMGLAFGTGRHPTTKLCLEWLAARRLEGLRVLDYGCGSGVLALAALVLGAERAFAVDVEPQALAATRENAERNGLRERLWIGRPEELPAVEADVVLANIIARTLESLAAKLTAHTAPGGRLVLSGLLEDQVELVRGAYASAFCDFALAATDGWARLVATRVRQ